MVGKEPNIDSDSSSSGLGVGGRDSIAVSNLICGYYIRGTEEKGREIKLMRSLKASRGPEDPLTASGLCLGSSWCMYVCRSMI